MNRRFTFALPLAALACSLSGVAHAGETRSITEFDGKDDLRWRTVVDGVMGGLSTARYQVEDGTLVFAGETSLENNGGFSSMRTRPQALEIGEFDGLALRVKGDGRSYRVALRAEGIPRMVAYWADLETKSGEWTEVRIPFSAWVPTSFGRELPGPALRTDRIDSVGFMLYDKKAGPFRLEVDWIRAYRGAAEATASAQGGTILQTAIGNEDFSTLVSAVKAAGLVEALAKPKAPLTVFAPTNAAFAKLPKHVLAGLLKPAQRAKLGEVLTYHVVPGELGLDALLQAQRLETLSGQRLAVKLEGGALEVGRARVREVVECSDGKIYVLDSVMLPELEAIPGVASKAKSFQTLLAAAKAAGLVEALSGDQPLTVFAPTDAAFAKLPQGTVEALLRPEAKEDLVRILKHHVVAGELDASAVAARGELKTLAGTTLEVTFTQGEVRVAGVPLVALDVPARNGRIHVVGQVLLPPTPEPTGVVAEGLQIIERAVSIGAPLYNDGNPGACRVVYELAAYGLLGLDGLELPAAVRRSLKEAIASPREGTTADVDAAWALRRALDATYAALSPQASK